MPRRNHNADALGRRLGVYSCAISMVWLTTVVCGPSAAANELLWHWQDKFSASEQARLQDWMQQTDAALTAWVGPLPFTRHIFFHRADYAREPVPWAHTQRGQRQGVHFYVDSSFRQEDFLQDWTAPHELSHLVLPYLGRRYAWLAEGFASYMQFQVMAAMGVIDEDEANSRYLRRFERAARKFAQQPALQQLPFSEAARELRRQRQFPTMYWGGAIFFWNVERWLRAHSDTDLRLALQAYVECCRKANHDIRSLMYQLDAAAGHPVFTTMLRKFETTPGFPEYRSVAGANLAAVHKPENSEGRPSTKMHTPRI